MIAEITVLLRKKFGEQVIIRVEEQGLQPIVVIDAAALLDVCFYLRDSEGLYFDFLANITAVDYFPENLFSLVYHLTSRPYHRQIVLKVELPNDRNPNNLPEVTSVSSVWRTADWHEREAFDLMGIFFTGHPDLRRILLPDDWEGFPLRKDYQDPESYHGISIK